MKARDISVLSRKEDVVIAILVKQGEMIEYRKVIETDCCNMWNSVLLGVRSLLCTISSL
jgi:hypothetical protein